MYPRSKHSPKKYALAKSKDSGNASTSNSGKLKDNRYSDIAPVIEDTEITLPVLKMVDSEKFLQCYRSVLLRPKEESVGIEDLDKLQTELELMLSNVVLRQRILHTEISHISAAEETKSRKTASLSIAKIKRLRKHEDRTDSDTADTDNENKDDDEDSLDELKELTIRNPPKRTIPLVPPSVVPVSRNDISNKFWAMVEPYCAEITTDDIKFMEDLIKSYDMYEKDEYKTIPSLGTHYSLRWAQNEVKDEKEITNWTKSENDIDEANDSKDDAVSSKVCVPGPMVQRLVSALVEENPVPSGSVTKRGRSEKELDENYGQPLMKKSKDMGINGFLSSGVDFSDVDKNHRLLPLYHTSQCFEKKVRKELEAIGFLDPANENNQEDADEVLNELERCQEELNLLAKRNKKVLLDLLQTLKTEFKRQQIKSQIKIINSELADINMKNISLKLKKKHFSKKEAEEAWKLLKERETLLMKLEETS